MNEDIFKKAFKNVKPSEELVNSVLELQNAPAVPKRTKRQSFYYKPRRIGIIGACAVFVIGVTAAAAEFIDFEAVFGNRITVKDSELASSLVGTVSNFKYKVSDSDYKIDIKGVTGSDKRVIVIAEISRIDGEPVVDHFVNPVSSDERYLDCLWSERDIFMTGHRGSWDYYINEAGNIEVFEDFEADDTKLSGKKISVEGKNFYPGKAYHDFLWENNVNYMYWRGFSGYAQYNEDDNVNVPVDIDDSGVIALDLEWEFSFKYTASDKSTEVKSLKAPEENFTIKQNVYNIHDTSDIFVCEITAVPTYIEAGSTGGSIDFEYEMNEYVNSLDYAVNFFDNNEVYIILKDGERLRSGFDGGSSRPVGNIYKCSYGLTYWDENDHNTFVNADDIEAISINGTVYELQ